MQGPSPALLASSPDQPVLLLFRPKAPAENCEFATVHLNTGETTAFETDLFRGSVAMWASGLKSSPKDMFGSRKRKSWVIIQGSFKERLNLGELWTGHRFSRPLSNLPAKLLLQLLLAFVKQVAPGVRLGNLSSPHMLTPLATTSQCIRVDPSEDKAPGISIQEDPVEDLQALRPAFTEPSSSAGIPSLADARRRWMARSANRKALYVEPGQIYTFHFWQHQLDLSTFELQTPVGKLQLLHKLNGQPLQIMSCTEDGRKLWEFEIWHDKLAAGSLG